MCRPPHLKQVVAEAGTDRRVQGKQHGNQKSGRTLQAARASIAGHGRISGRGGADLCRPARHHRSQCRRRWRETGASSQWPSERTWTIRPRRGCTRSGRSSASFRRIVCEPASSSSCKATGGRKLSPMRSAARPCSPPSSWISTESRRAMNRIRPSRHSTANCAIAPQGWEPARGVPAESLNQLIQGVDEPGAFADLVAFYLDLQTAEKQAAPGSPRRRGSHAPGAGGG